MFSLFLAKEKKDFMELTETLNWLHVFLTQILGYSFITMMYELKKD